MKTFKKVLASALAAAMVVTAFPVTNAEAATKAKLSATKATIYVGKSKTIKVTLPKGAKITSVKSSKKAVATVKKSGKKVVVKAVKAGKAKVTVKVTPKKGKATNLKATITVKNEAIRVSGASVVAVGATATLKTATAPKNATVTFKSSDDTIATVDEKGVVTGVKAGKVTITATAGKASKDVEIEVKNYVLTDVAQTKLTELTATVAGSTKDLKTTDFAVKNATTNVVYPVSKVAVDAKDATKVTLTLFSGLKDAANYDVTLDGVTKSFKASDGKVANIALNTATVPYATETEIKLVSKDANGVVIDEVAYDPNPNANASYDFAIDAKGNGYTNGSKLYLNKVGDTAEATITYKSGKYDQNGKPEGNIGPNKVTITAVEQSAINSFAVRIDDNTKASFEKAKDTNKISVGDASKSAFFCIKNADGKEITNYSGYSVESSDKTVLMIATPTLGSKHEVGITAVKTGTAYILFKDKDGKIVNSVAVEVVAEKAVATIELDKYSVVVSNDTTLDQKKTVNVKLKDQYGNDWAGSYNTTATFLSASNGKTKADVASLVTVAGKKVTISGKDIAAGNYVYKIAYNKDGKEVVAKTLTISVQAPTGTVSSYRLDLSETSVDVKVDNDNKTTKTITAELMGLAGGVDKAVTTAVNYTVKKADGTVVYGGEKAVTGAAFSVDGSAYGVTPVATSTLTIKLVDVTSSKATKTLAAGTYYVTAEKTIDSKKVSITSSFTVTDTQTKASASVKENLVTATTVKAALENALSVSYGDDVYCNRADKPNGAKPLNIIKVEGQLNNGAKITDASTVTAGQYFTVTKLVVNVEVATGITMDVEVSVPGTITIK